MDMFNVKKVDVLTFDEMMKCINGLSDRSKPLKQVSDNTEFNKRYVHLVKRHPTFSHDTFDNSSKAMGINGDDESNKEDRENDNMPHVIGNKKTIKDIKGPIDFRDFVKKNPVK